MRGVRGLRPQREVGGSENRGRNIVGLLGIIIKIEPSIFHSNFSFLSDVLDCHRGRGPLEDQVRAGQHLASPQQRSGARQVKRKHDNEVI